MGRARAVRERRRGLAMTLRRLPAVAQQLQLPKASGKVRAKAFALVWAGRLRRQWPVVLIFAIIVGAAVLGRYGDGGR